MEQRTLKKLQNTELEILNEFVSICEKHNLEYFLAGGTLLGAVRHKGFIPWDDDIDVSMPRKDYNKFIKICKKELDSRFFLDCYETNKYCWFPFAKIRIKNSEMVEKISKNVNFEQGIWIDIFPINNVKNKFGKTQLKQQKIHDYIRTLITIKLNVPYYNKSLKRLKFYKCILRIVPFGLLKFIFKLYMNKNINSKTDYVCCYSGAYGIKKETFKKNVFFPTKKIMFCDMNFNAPKKYREYLEQIYGDYMIIPPKEKRITHNPLYIKFPDGEEIIFEKEEI